jgi:hypothetical protein
MSLAFDNERTATVKELDRQNAWSAPSTAANGS